MIALPLVPITPRIFMKGVGRGENFQIPVPPVALLTDAPDVRASRTYFPSKTGLPRYWKVAVPAVATDATGPTLYDIE